MTGIATWDDISSTAFEPVPAITLPTPRTALAIVLALLRIGELNGWWPARIGLANIKTHNELQLHLQYFRMSATELVIRVKNTRRTKNQPLFKKHAGTYISIPQLSIELHLNLQIYT